jgi:hypothetical protein
LPGDIDNKRRRSYHNEQPLYISEESDEENAADDDIILEKGSFNSIEMLREVENNANDGFFDEKR